MRKFISTILIIIGLAIILYPLGRGMYGDYQQRQILAEWDKVSQMLVEEPVVLDELDEGELVDEEAERERVRQREAAEKDRLEYIANNMEGVLVVDKINLRLPILRGSSERNFLIATGTLETGAKAGEVGNYAIAGHRNYGYGRHFNRLDELEAGDIIGVETNNNLFHYIVTEKLYVEPEEVSVLKSKGQEAEITLITCHPVDNPTQRLIVKGKLIQDN